MRKTWFALRDLSLMGFQVEACTSSLFGYIEIEVLVDLVSVYISYIDATIVGSTPSDLLHQRQV